MPVLTWATNHRFWVLGLGVLAAVLVAVAAGVWFFLLGARVRNSIFVRRSDSTNRISS